MLTHTMPASSSKCMSCRRPWKEATQREAKARMDEAAKEGTLPGIGLKALPEGEGRAAQVAPQSDRPDSLLRHGTKAGFTNKVGPHGGEEGGGHASPQRNQPLLAPAAAPAHHAV